MNRRWASLYRYRGYYFEGQIDFEYVTSSIIHKPIGPRRRGCASQVPSQNQDHTHFGEAGRCWEIGLKSMLELLTGASGRNSVSSQVVKVFIIGVATRTKLDTLN
jgi:hypothetical protein